MREGITSALPSFFKAQLAYSQIKSRRSCQVVSDHDMDSLPKCPNYNAENHMNSPKFSTFKLVLVAGSEIEYFTNPG